MLSLLFSGLAIGKSIPDRDVRSGEAGEAVPHLKNCTKKNKNKSIQLK